MDEARTEATDPDRLLPGEASDTGDPDDIRHWVAVYRELVTFKERLLASFEPDGDRPTRQAGSFRVTELGSLQAEYDRLHRRLIFWEARARDLAAS